MSANRYLAQERESESEQAAYATHIVADIMTRPDQEALANFLESARYTHYLQTLPWLNAQTDAQHNYFYILTFSADGQIVAAALVRRRHIRWLGKAKFFIERGPVFNTPEALNAHLAGMISLLAAQGLWIRINPYILPGDTAIADIFRRHGFYANPQDRSAYHATVLIDLQQPLDTIKAGFRRSLRTQINKAQREAITVAPCRTEQEFQQFLQGLNRFRQEKKLPPIDQAIALAVYQHLLAKQEKGVLLLASYQEEVVAGIALFGANRYLIYEWGFSSGQEAHRKLPLSHVLHWAGITWAQKKRYQYYDFGGYWLERGEEDSINRFKSGFSPLIEQVMQPRQKYLAPITGRMLDYFSRLKKQHP